MIYQALSLERIRAVTVADFYHRGGNGPTTTGGAVLWDIYIYLYISIYIYIYLYIRFRHGSLFCHQASGCVNSSSAAHALCGIGIAPYVATFLVNIFHLPRSYSYLANLEKSSPIHTWSSGRLRWRELEDTCTNADGWHEWRWFQISDFSIWFPNKVHRSSRNKYAECRINSIFLRSNLPI